MKINKYIVGLGALLLGTACSNEEISTVGWQGDEIQFTATLQTPQVVNRSSENDKVLPYINGIHVRRIGTAPSTDAGYNVKNGNKGTLEVIQQQDGSPSTALAWTSDEKTNNTTVHFYSWTTPDGVTMTGDNPTDGTIDFGETAGNRAPKYIKDDLNSIDYNNVTPLEVFISAHTTGNYHDNPSVSLPFSHPVAKIGMEVFNWNNQRITDEVTITFPLINKVWKLEQDEKNGSAFAVTTPKTPSGIITLGLKNLGSSDNYRIFYLPPMVGNYTFEKAGDFELVYNGNIYYGTLNNLNVNQLAAGEYMTCRIDLNENYGTGVGAHIYEWKFGKEDIAYADPYRGIYTTKGLEVLKECLESNEHIPDSLYIDGNNTPGDIKIIRLYNNLDLSSFGKLSLALKQNMIFDGLGHTVTVPSSKSLFDITATGVEINNVRLLGAGQLANSLSGGKVYNCHANGSGNLVGTASGSTSFDFCSAEKEEKGTTTSPATLIGTATGNDITITNSFVATGATSFASSSTGTVTAQNSFIIGYQNYYWASSASSGTAGTTFTIDTDNVTATKIGDKKLIDLLNEDSNTLNSTSNKKYWVYVYNKSYPVMRVK